MIRNIFVWTVFALIAFSLFLGSWHVLHGDIVFHTDIARDFLVMQDIVKTRKPTLIGPRAGGIPGMFHGPLWFYVNLPAFIIGKGNPVAVGWFWVLLTIISIGIVYFTAKRLFGRTAALLASLLFSVFTVSYTPALFNSFGAVMVFPVFFYLFVKYHKTGAVRDLMLALFVLGLVVQFQVGFGGAILVLAIPYLIIYLIRKKKLKHLLSFFILLIPLSTFILFEIRHNFLEITSAVNFFTTKSESASFNLVQFISSRLNGMLFSGLGLTSSNPLYTLPVTLAFAWILFKSRSGKFKSRETYLLYFYFYIGFWVLMLFFKGEVWGFFYWPFLPVTIIIASSLWRFIDKRIFAPAFAALVLLNFSGSWNSLKDTGNGWRTYYTAARNIYKDAQGSDFGYYVFSPDLYAYSGRYAISYMQGQYPGSKSFPYEKRALTYLFMNTVPENMHWLSPEWWKNHQVNITGKPEGTIRYGNMFTIQKYILTQKEIEKPSDPNLIQDLTFR